MALALHVDANAFFAQVEALRSPGGSLLGVPLAVQQHADVIAVDYAARAAGVTKHMAPAEARRLLAAVGGRVVHVYCEDGTRPSYRPYRETSGALMRLLRSLLPPGGVLERASLDEAYMLVPAPCPNNPAPDQGAGQPGGAQPQHAAPAAAPAAAAAGGGARAAAAAAVADAGLLGERIRTQALQRLGLRVSVGVARNKLLAKLASLAAKPDGLRVLCDADGVEALLQSVPVGRLPGLGGPVAEALAAEGYGTAAALRGLAPGALAERFGVRPALAASAVRWAHGEDDRPVQQRGPPKALQIQMTLTPVPRPAPAGMAARAFSAAAPPPAPDGAPAPSVPAVGPLPGPNGSPMLMPLTLSSPDGRGRLERLLRSMAADLVARVLLDRHEEQRWPRKLAVQLVTHGAGGKAASAACSFPTPALTGGSLASEGAACVGGVGACNDASLFVSERTYYRPDEHTALLGAVASAAMAMCGSLLTGPQAALPLVQVQVTAHTFQPFASATAAGSISRFLGPRSTGAEAAGPRSPGAAAAGARTTAGAEPAAARGQAGMHAFAAATELQGSGEPPPKRQRLEDGAARDDGLSLQSWGGAGQPPTRVASLRQSPARVDAAAMPPSAAPLAPRPPRAPPQPPSHLQPPLTHAPRPPPPPRPQPEPQPPMQQPQRQHPAEARSRPQQLRLPPPLDLPALLEELTCRPGAVADGVLRSMEAWLTAFGAPTADEWWRGLAGGSEHTDGPGQRTPGGEAG